MLQLVKLSKARCAECGVSPIVVTRFTCEVCGNLDLCEPCKEGGTHSEHGVEEVECITVEEVSLEDTISSDDITPVFVDDW